MTFTQFNEDSWLDSELLGYRITSTQVAVMRDYGLTYVTRYYACVRCINDGHRSWQFARHRKPYATFEAAVKACQWHHSIWTRLVKLATARGNRLERLTKLTARSRGRRVQTTEELARDNAFWRRKGYLGPDALTQTPQWAAEHLTEKFQKLMRRARTACLAQEQRAYLLRGSKPRKKLATAS